MGVVCVPDGGKDTCVHELEYKGKSKLVKKEEKVETSKILFVFVLLIFVLYSGHLVQKPFSIKDSSFIFVRRIS